MASRTSALSGTLRASQILGIAGEVRALIEQGKPILNLTVGDFSSKQFRIPRELEDHIVEALRAGESTYPPSNGVEALRVAVRDFYRARLGIDYPAANILVGSGARPVIYATYRALVDPGETVVFSVPSWNNDYYCEMIGARAVPVECDARTNFQPTAEMLRPHVRGTRMLALGSPLNPTGTAIDADQLGAICDLVLEENARRGPNERPLFLMYDHVYWMITADGVKHADPVSLRPAIEPYTIIIDAISKAFASTGLRVGWAAGPADVIAPMNALLSHVGAWAPRPEQVATAKFLGETSAVDAYIVNMRTEARMRLDAVYDGLSAMARDGLPVECVRPQGAIYVSARFALHGMRSPDGTALETDEDVRKYLLNAAGLAVVPFGAFGSPAGSGWFRLSIGVVSVAQIEEMMPRLKRAIGAVEGAVAGKGR